MKRRDYIILLVFLWSPITQFASRVIDGSSALVDSTQSYLVATGSNRSIVIQYGLIAILGMLIFIEFCDYQNRNYLEKKSLRIVLANSSVRNFMLVTCSITLVIELIHGSSSKDMLGTGLLLLFVSTTGELTLVAMKKMALLCVFSNVLIIFYFILKPSQSWKPCRTTKCPVGMHQILVSYFSHENYMGMFVALSFFFAVFLTSRFLFVSQFFMSGFIVYASSSQVAYAMFLVMSLFLLNKRRVLQSILPYFPLLGFLGSSTFFVIASGYDLTGRGYIYDLIKSQFASHPFIGEDRKGLQQLFVNRQANMNFLAFHEHGQVPFLVFEYGLTGVVIGLIFCFLARKLKKMKIDSYFLLIPLLTCSVAFATEETIVPNLFAAFSWVLLLPFCSGPELHTFQRPWRTKAEIN